MTAADACARALAAIEACDDPAIVTSVVDRDWLLERAAEIDAKPPESVPLRGSTFAVKDNIDVAGAVTTAGCPSFGYVASRSAAVVERLLDVGAVPVAKVNMDQFATGLVGTRSPYGAPRNPFDPSLVPGGSSSGSAAAVSAGLVTFALGTDTAGSGRVPAAMHGLVGLKPTPGAISCRGVVPAVRSLDCVSVFTDRVSLAADVVRAAVAHDPDDPYSRRQPGSRVPAIRRVATLGAERLAALGVEPDLVDQYQVAIDRLTRLGYETADIDPTALFEIGDQLYEGPWVSERLAAVGEFMLCGADDIDPVVARIIGGSGKWSATDVHRAHYRRAALLQSVTALFDDVDALALPTIGWHVRLAEVWDDPMGPNARLGRFTTFTNLADMCAIAVPMPDLGEHARPPFSLTIHAPAWCDPAAIDVAARVVGERSPEHSLGDAPGSVLLAVAGAHLRGQPLEHQLRDRHARWVGTTTTAPVYRLYAMSDSLPPRPALVRVDHGGVAIEVDLWSIDAGGLGEFLTQIPAPLGLGRVQLADGRDITGFIAEPRALDGAHDISHLGGWRAYTAVGSKAVSP